MSYILCTLYDLIYTGVSCFSSKKKKTHKIDDLKKTKPRRAKKKTILFGVTVCYNIYPSLLYKLYIHPPLLYILFIIHFIYHRLVMAN